MQIPFIKDTSVVIICLRRYLQTAQGKSPGWYLTLTDPTASESPRRRSRELEPSPGAHVLEQPRASCAAAPRSSRAAHLLTRAAQELPALPGCARACGREGLSLLLKLSEIQEGLGGYSRSFLFVTRAGFESGSSQMAVSKIIHFCNNILTAILTLPFKNQFSKGLMS